MNILQVGGCVRDQLLGRAVQDRDWLVVGATPEEMVAQGFKPVGKDFPVFLHPDTHEEYALARTERKSGRGHGGFIFYSAPSVSVEEDLIRRDLTINAMALDTAPDGQPRLIDPFGGQHDLQHKILRHVSLAFAEDPLRVFRVARFAARFPDFSLAEETRTLMQSMVAEGELLSLSAERVWVEFRRGLGEGRPRRMMEVLDDCGALAVWFPEIARCHGVPQDQAWHPEKDVFEHILLVLEAATKLSSDPLIRFGALCHDLGKGTTAREDWPHHPHHAERGETLAKELALRLKAPKDFLQFGAICARWHDAFFELNDHPHDINLWLTLFQGVDVWRRPQNLARLIQVVQSDYSGRPGFDAVSFSFLNTVEKIAETLRATFLAHERPHDESSRLALIKARMHKAIMAHFPSTNPPKST